MIWLVRHGESEANAGGVTSDYDTIALTAKGWAQAEAVAGACSEQPSWVGLSPYRRARQTAEPLRAKFPEAPVEELAVQEFTYLAAARCAGMDGAARQPLVDSYWARNDPAYSDGAGAESYADFCGRASAFLRWAADRPGFGIAFSHEQFIRAVMVEVLYGAAEPSPAGMRRFFALRAGLPVPNGAIARLHWHSGRWWSGGIDGFHLPIPSA